MTTYEVINLNENNTFEITDEVLAIMEAVLNDVEEQTEEEEFDFSTLFSCEISDEEAAEIEAKEEEERIKKQVSEAYKVTGVKYDAEKKYKKCPRCCGQGRMDCYAHISNGICFKCGGARYVPV